MKLAGETVVVTGASSGIGAAVARRFASRGADVVLVARRGELLEREVEAIRAAGGSASCCAADLSESGAVEALAALSRERGLPPAVLVNNAGSGRWLETEATGPAEAVAAMAVPYFAAFYATRALLPGMLARGRGHVVTVTSAAAFVAWPGATAYTAARWAMRGFHEALTADLRGTGVGTSLVTCGKVDTDYFTVNPGTEARIPRIARLYRTLSADEVARAIVSAVERKRRYVLLPPLLRLTLAFHRLLPRPVAWLVARTGWRREQSGPGG